MLSCGVSSAATPKRDDHGIEQGVGRNGNHQAEYPKFNPAQALIKLRQFVNGSGRRPLGLNRLNLDLKLCLPNLDPLDAGLKPPQANDLGFQLVQLIPE